jgi:tetratricopeptide (TPR) repeat protein
MKNRSRIDTLLLVILSTGLITLWGCSEDFFNRTAGDRITPDQHYKSTNDFVISTDGAISSLQEAMPRLIMVDGLRSDAMDVTSYAGADLRNINHHVFSPGNPYTDPSDLYKVIININEVLAHIDEIQKNEVLFDEYVTFYATGELIAMRSWAYLTLVRLYNRASYIGDNMTSLPENLEQNVLSKEDMIDTLINQVIPYIFDATVGTERVELKLGYYVNSKAILGELYLEKGEYALAAEYLKLACESYLNSTARFKVDKSYQNEGWVSIFLNAESNFIENISVIPFSSVEDQNNPLASWMGYGQQYLVKPSGVLVDSFMTQEPAAGPLGDPYRGFGISFYLDSAAMELSLPDYTFITKYAMDQNDPFGSDIVISRAADLHLMLAEAYNRMGDEDSEKYALMFLNKGVNNESPKPPQFSQWRNNIGIRGRAYLKPKEVPEALTGDARTRYIEDLIIAEKALEMAFEGKRWFDLVRVAERRGDPAFLADKVAAKFEGTPMYDQIHGKLMDPANWYLPSDYLNTAQE